MMKKIKQSQKGAISMFVMLAMMFFLVTIMGMYMMSAKRAQTQTESIGLLQEQYYTDEQENQLYDEKKANDTDIIPIYTKEQLWSIGNGGTIEIEGKVYDFSQSNLNQYELKNDIVINIETDLKNSRFKDDLILGSSTIRKNNFEVLYYYEGKYYVPTAYSNGTQITNFNEEKIAVLSASGEDFSIINQEVTDLSGKYYLFALAKEEMLEEPLAEEFEDFFSDETMNEI